MNEDARMILSRRAALAAALTAFAAASPALAARRLFGPSKYRRDQPLHGGGKLPRQPAGGHAGGAGEDRLPRVRDRPVGARTERVRAARERAGLACASVSVLPTPAARGGPSLATDPVNWPRRCTPSARTIWSALFPAAAAGGGDAAAARRKRRDAGAASGSRAGLTPARLKRTSEMLDAQGEALPRRRQAGLPQPQSGAGPARRDQRPGDPAGARRTRSGWRSRWTPARGGRRRPRPGRAAPRLCTRSASS